LEQQQEARTRFQMLSQQLELTEDVYMSFFEEGELSRLTVHKKNRLWNFSIKLRDILPFQLYQLFRTRLTEKFAAIAQIHTTFDTVEKNVTEELVQQYWLTVVEQIDDMAPPLKHCLVSQMPMWNGQKITLSCMQELEFMMLKTKYAEKLSESYSQFGFPHIVIDFVLQEQSEELIAAQEAFMEQKRLEEAALSQQAIQDYQKREQEKKENPALANLGDRPFQLGMLIKDDETMEIKRIVEEERRIIIEGFVFDAEVKELKSGRSLLQIKITDYTDSIVVKMFSRDNDDAELMQHLKKGMWVKVRGSVQTDTFIRDLIVMANDINEIKKETRQDKAPEGEKRVELHLHTPMSTMDAVTPVDRLVAQAAKWGHPAVAITDHAVVQSFPEAYSAGKKHGIKVIYGLEANLVDDGVPIAYASEHRLLADTTYVVFDVETTGLSTAYDTIIELAAVKIKDGNVIDNTKALQIHIIHFQQRLLN